VVRRASPGAHRAGLVIAALLAWIVWLIR